MFLTLFVATHVSILTSDTSTIPPGYGFIGLQNAPLLLKSHTLNDSWKLSLIRPLNPVETVINELNASGMT